MLNDKPVVILDSDDVLGRCAKKMCETAHAHIGKLYTEEDLTGGWDFFDTVKHPEYPDLKKHVETQMRTKGWCLGMEAFPGAVEGLKKLETIAEVFVCTSPFGGEHWEHERRTWLYETFGIRSKRVLQGMAKFLVRGEFFVDDKPKNVHEWIDYGDKHQFGGVGLLWDRPHNRNEQALRRVYGWDELCRFIEGQ